MISGCSDDDSTGDTVLVETSGDHGVIVGETTTLQATTINGTDSAYTWASDDESVATVDVDGVVTGVAAGEAMITATGADSGVSGMHAIVVIPAGMGDPTVIITGDVFIKKGATSDFSAATRNGNDSGYTWGSSDETIATVDADTGEVTGINPGLVTIEATGMDTLIQGFLDVHVNIDIPNEDAWLSSGHADFTAEAFRHWDEDGEVSASCAKCHGGSAGYRDYLGDDGTAPWVVDNAAPLGGVVDCNTCHNATASNLSTVIFPSGVQVDGLGPEARCMTCHQGRESGDSVEASIDATAAAAPDTIDSTLGFLNIHYYAAGATLNAGRVRGGYQYAGQTYDWRFRHVPGYDTCVGCHNPHTLEVKITECAACHAGVTTVDDIKNVRMMASMNHDYDGDGDVTEGIFHEMDGLRTKLYTAMQTYGTEVISTGICYSAASYPYFFIDTDSSGGPCDASEANFGNRFTSWTPRLVRAAYNYQVSLKDPGAHAHNAKYIIQLLFDSITDLNTQLTTAVDMTNAVRNDSGHFNGAGEPARHWDGDEAVSADCSKCHGGSEGYRFFVKYGVGGQDLEQDNGLDCATCHNDLTTGNTSDLVAVSSVTFPGDVTHDMGDANSNMCGTCHSGRESTATVNTRISNASYGFRNVHYLPAAGVRAGDDAAVGYQYATKTYSTAWSHTGGNSCTSCHNPVSTQHSFHANDAFDAAGGCGSTCHSAAADVHAIRMTAHAGDYDGDGNTSETLADEISGLAAALITAIRAEAVANGTSICYAPNNYPYWYVDNIGATNGVCDPTEDYSSGNRFGGWNLNVGLSGYGFMKACFNYQVYKKEPGAWAHNFNYMAQLLIDSTEDMGGDVSSFTRPTP